MAGLGGHLSQQDREILERDGSFDEVDHIGVHRTHCCFIHGCKYGVENCPVESGEIEQDYLCECCDADGIKSVEEIKAMKTLGIKKCTDCGHYYKTNEFPNPRQ